MMATLPKCWVTLCEVPEEASMGRHADKVAFTASYSHKLDPDQIIECGIGLNDLFKNDKAALLGPQDLPFSYDRRPEAREKGRHRAGEQVSIMDEYY